MIKIPILSTIVLRIEYKRKGIKIWRPANVYPSARLGRNVSVGMFSEIGPNVEIGDNTRIGFGCFIPEGVKIGKNCFIGPRCTFSNDMYPPGPKWAWKKTVIEDNVSLGANVSIRPGVTVKSGSIIGMGSVIIYDVPGNEIWAGNPLRFLRNRCDECEHVVEVIKEGR